MVFITTVDTQSGLHNSWRPRFKTPVFLAHFDTSHCTGQFSSCLLDVSWGNAEGNFRSVPLQTLKSIKDLILGYSIQRKRGWTRLTRRLILDVVPTPGPGPSSPPPPLLFSSWVFLSNLLYRSLTCLPEKSIRLFYH
jgi:hypothetical protein